MKILRFTSNLLALGILALGFSSMANAQATRTWVSGLGDDANPCSRTAPCKTFAGAYSRTQVNGEIDCIDPGGFGAISISKSITINCDAGPGGILPGSTNAVNINGAGIVVTLRAIDLQGVGLGINGVNITQAGFVHLIDMNIYGFTGVGVNVAASSNVFLTIRDTQIHDCTTAGIQLNTTSGIAVADVDHVAIYNTANGINGQTGSHFVVHNSTFLQDTIAVNQTGSGSAGTVVGSTFSFNGTAFQSIAGSVMGVSGNTISGSSPVFNANGGTLSSGNDNVNFANGALGTAAGGQLTKI